MLTKRQRDLLVFIQDYQARSDGVAPSFEEMKAIGVRSKSIVKRLVDALTERGYIVRLPHRARAITVMKTPDGTDILGVSPPPQLGNIKDAYAELASILVPALQSKWNAFNPVEKADISTAWAKLGQVIRSAA